jgi:hypothetical protein
MLRRLLLPHVQTAPTGPSLGTATRLYKLNTGVSPYGFTDISGASAPYAVPTGQLWQFERFKTKLYACSLGAAAAGIRR